MLSKPPKFEGIKIKVISRKATGQIEKKKQGVAGDIGSGIKKKTLSLLAPKKLVVEPAAQVFFCILQRLTPVSPYFHDGERPGAEH